MVVAAVVGLVRSGGRGVFTLDILYLGDVRRDVLRGSEPWCADV